jgi:HD-GYP domain-containing protein (c-di-GMP phosphodiesterase class II)
VARAIVASVRTIEADGAGHVTASVGYASLQSDGDTADALFAAADSALYNAKNAGRDQAHRFQPNVFDLASVRRRSSDAAQLRAARALANAMEVADRLRDTPHEEVEAATHSNRVSELAGRLAFRLGLSADVIVLVRLAAQVHDIGKLSVPIEILTKTESLGEEEWRTLREHPEMGRRMLDSLGVGAVADWVLHHHERWDGTGYPSGLAGEDIPLPARIIFVADAFDAMTSIRPYRQPLSVDAALAELIGCSGSQFDPTVVDALVAELAEAAEPITRAALA